MTMAMIKVFHEYIWINKTPPDFNFPFQKSELNKLTDLNKK